MGIQMDFRINTKRIKARFDTRQFSYLRFTASLFKQKGVTVFVTPFACLAVLGAPLQGENFVFAWWRGKLQRITDEKFRGHNRRFTGDRSPKGQCRDE